MLEKKSGHLDIAIQKAVDQARDTNFFRPASPAEGFTRLSICLKRTETWCCLRNYPELKKRN